MKDIKEKAIRKRVLVPLTLTFLVLISTFIYGGSQIRADRALSDLHHRYQGVEALFTELLDQQGELMRVTAALVAKDDNLRNAMLNQDRQRLFQLSQPFYQQISERYGMTHLYYHTLEGNTFLRVHRPEQFGDPVNRQTFQRASKSGTLSYGLELGVLGTFTYRAVFPWYMNNQLIGYIELGEEIDGILTTLKAITRTDFLLTIDKKHLDQKQWETGMRMLGRSADWDHLPGKAIIDQTIPDISYKYLEKYLSSRPYSADPFSEIQIQNRDFRLKSFPLLDAVSRKVGDFFVLYDVTAENKSFADFVARITIVSLVLCSALFAFAYGILGRMDKRLHKTRQQLHAEIDRATEMNQQLAIEISERNRAQQDLKTLNENLEERVAERTLDLEKLNHVLDVNRQDLEEAYSDLKAKHATILHQDKMACIGQLAAGVAHDINNPIGFVANNLGELQVYLNDLTKFVEFQDHALVRLKQGEDCLDWLDNMRGELKVSSIIDDISVVIDESREGTDRVSKIVNNLRTFSRIDDSDCEEANLIDCLNSTINITWNELRYKAKIVKDYQPLPLIRCFPGQINQVFMNLLLNASQAIDGYGSITVKTWAEDADVFVSIADTGCGIPEDVVKKIFEPFFTTKETGKGTGLGLSITYDIVKRHGGDIAIDSVVGQGTMFTIRLPIEGGCHEA